MSSDFSLVAEVERLAAQSRDAHLGRAKQGYIRRVQITVESIVMQAIVAASGPYDTLYPEIDAWAVARHTDIAGDVAGALAVLMERELLVWQPPPAASAESEQEEKGRAE